MQQSDVPGFEAIKPLLQSSPIRYIRNVCMAFLQGVYNAVEGPYHWEPDQNNSKIIIAATVPVDGKVFGNRPCIACARSALQFAGAGVGSLDEVETSTGAFTKSDFINSVMVFHHISSKEAEAEDLAFFSAEMIWMHSNFLAKYFIATMGTLNVGEPGPAGSLVEGDAKGLVTVPVTMPFRMSRRSRAEPLGAPVLQAVTARITQIAPDVVNYPSPPRDVRFPADPAVQRRQGPRTLLVDASQPTGSMRSSVRVRTEE